MLSQVTAWSKINCLRPVVRFLFSGGFAPENHHHFLREELSKKFTSTLYSVLLILPQLLLIFESKNNTPYFICHIAISDWNTLENDSKIQNICLKFKAHLYMYENSKQNFMIPTLMCIYMQQYCEVFKIRTYCASQLQKNDSQLNSTRD